MFTNMIFVCVYTVYVHWTNHYMLCSMVIATNTPASFVGNRTHLTTDLNFFIFDCCMSSWTKLPTLKMPMSPECSGLPVKSGPRVMGKEK